MKVAVIGSRGFNDSAKLYSCLEREPISEIISGGAKGADTLAESFAKEKGIPAKIFLPEYAKFGRGAPLERNKLIIDHADYVVAFWDRKSRGTKHAIDYAKAKGKLVKIVDS